MPRGDKSKYTDKQERKADHIAESYEERGLSEKEAERRAWATVNKDDGGGKKPGGSGRGKETGHPAAHKGGKLAGGAQGREARRRGRGVPPRGRSFGLCAESRRHARAQRFLIFSRRRHVENRAR